MDPNFKKLMGVYIEKKVVASSKFLGPNEWAQAFKKSLILTLDQLSSAPNIYFKTLHCYCHISQIYVLRMRKKASDLNIQKTFLCVQIRRWIIISGRHISVSYLHIQNYLIWVADMNILKIKN